MKRRLVGIVMAVLLGTSVDAAALAANFTVFNSPGDDGVAAAGGVASLALDGSPTTLNLWFVPESIIFGYSGLRLSARPGLELVSFLEAPGVIVNKELALGRVTLDGGDLNGSAAAGRLGTAVVRAIGPGAALEVTAGSFADDSFQAINVAPVPQLVAVPEPGMSLLLGTGLLAIGFGRRRHSSESVVERR